MYKTQSRTTKYLKTFFAFCAVFAFATSILLSQPNTARADTNYDVTNGLKKIYENSNSGYVNCLSNINVATYKYLEIHMYIELGNADRVQLNFNNDTSTQYDTKVSLNSGTQSGSAADSYRPTGNNNANTHIYAKIEIINHPTNYKFIMGDAMADGNSVLTYSKYYNSSPITEIDLCTATGNAYIGAGSRVIVYGTNYDDQTVVVPDAGGGGDVPDYSDYYYMERIYNGAILFLIMMFGFMFYFLLKYKK